MRKTLNPESKQSLQENVLRNVRVSFLLLFLWSLWGNILLFICYSGISFIEKTKNNDTSKTAIGLKVWDLSLRKAQELRLTTCMWVKEAFSGSSAGSLNSVKQFSIATPLCCLFLFRSFYRSVYLLPSLGLVTNYRLRGTWRLVMMLLIQDFMSIFFVLKESMWSYVHFITDLLRIW